MCICGSVQYVCVYRENRDVCMWEMEQWMCVYMYICICIQVCVYICVCMYTGVCIYMCVHARACAYMCVCSGGSGDMGVY